MPRRRCPQSQTLYACDELRVPVWRRLIWWLDSSARN
jgi:hypothetical protein